MGECGTETALMTRILFVTSDLPLLLRTYCGPRAADEEPLLVSAAYQGQLMPWIGRLPRRVRWWLLKRLLKIHKQPADAFDKLAKLADVAPHLLGALTQGQWRAMAWIERGLEPWRNYLPGCAAKLAYFEDTGAPEFKAEVARATTVKKQGPFKVLFDLRWMELGQAGGIEQATYKLVSAISQLDRRNAYRIFAPRSACTEWDFPAGFQVQQHYSDPVSRRFEVAHAFLANKLAESLGKCPVLTPQVRSLAGYHKLDFDMVHSVAGYTSPDLMGFPGVLTINDLQHRHYPEFFAPEDVAHRERLYRESAERAKHIICISEFTRQDVHRQYGIALEKMSTVWIIPGRDVWRPLRESARGTLLAGMQLTSTTPFFFFPAHCWPHKNHARLVEAFARIASELPPDVKLVMTGRPLPAEHPAALLMREHNLSKRVMHLGYRSPLEVRALFQGCMALVFPSLFEGFGMPVAEAIIAGKPVLCSNVTALPELAGEAALTFDPNSVEEIAKGMLDVATQPALRLALGAAAVRRRPLFSARRSALQTVAIYQRVHDEFYGG